MTQSSFYADGEVLDAAVVESNDSPGSDTPSSSPSSFYATGGVAGAGTVVSNETEPDASPSQAPSSFFNGGSTYDTAEVASNDAPGSSIPSQSPSGFYQQGGIYDQLSEESAALAQMNALAAQTSADKTAADTSAASAATSAAAAATTLSGSLQKANNLSDLTSVPTAKANLSLTKGDVGLGNVDNTSDASKPVSTAQGTALAIKADKTYVDSQDAIKADKTYVDSQDAIKADKTYVDAQDGTLAASLLTKAATTYVDTQDSLKVALAGNQNITGGYTITAKALGNLSSFTPNPLLGNYQYGTNVGAITITAPSVDCAVDIIVTNSSTAGAISFSGFRGGLTGEPLTTTNTSKFLISIRRIGGDAMYAIKALQ